MEKLAAETTELVDYNEEEDNQVTSVPIQDSEESNNRYSPHTLLILEVTMQEWEVLDSSRSFWKRK